MSCGTKLQPEWRFCANCRRPVEDGGPPQDSREDPAADEPGASVPAAALPGAAAPVGGEPSADGATPIIETGTPDHASPTPPRGEGFTVPPGSGSGTGGGDGSGPDGPAGGDAPNPEKKTNRKAIILGAVAVVVLALGVGAFLFIQNMVRGGAGSPEQVAEKLMESIETKDGIGLVTMVAPAERESLDKFREGVTEKIEDFGIIEAANKVGENTQEADSEINFDGITVTFENVAPEVTEVDDQLAILKFTSGTVRLQVDPEQTKGAVRSGLEAADEMDAIDETKDLSELGVDGEGLLLAAVKDDGRWYVSPLYSGLEMVTQYTDSERGSLPEGTDGSDSPAEAAQALIGAVPGILESGRFTDLGNYLTSYEGNAVHYYGGAVDKAMDGGTGFGMELKSNTFKDAEKDGDRGRAVVEDLEMEAQGETVRLTTDCIEVSGSEEICRGKSGYVMTNGSFQQDAIVRALPPLSLSSIKEDGTWKVSLMDTTTDWALQWMDSLTREQALAMLDLARSEDPAGTLTFGEKTDLTFNSAGYAVKTLKLDEDTTLQGAADGRDYSSFTVYSQDGREEITSSSSYSPVETPAGEYKVVIFAGSEWADEFAEKGNDVQYSGSMVLEEFTAPPMIDGYENEQYNYLTLDDYPGPTKTHVLDVPKGGEVELLVTSEGYGSAWDKPGTLALTLDGKTYKVPVTNDLEDLTVPVTEGMGQELTVELQKGAGGGDEVDYTLELVAK
ncbi:hypothetical protein ABIB35_001761 [Arthrobacter sp. UYP6]|uniref:hypothetical protein n=1 Tax=Arthrobacter sp. UYP6 TaxID=1756378 RepID=UPI0033922BCF